MARRRKNRTHLKGGAASNPGATEGVPKSFVIKHGQVGTSLTQLVRDMRKVMEPYTASRLKERTRNKLKDFFTMAPALGVTHLLAFTLTDVAPSLRIVRLSAGPTLSFRIERYSLVKDVLNSSRRARSIGSVEYLSPPLLVLASFPQPGPGTPPHLPLLMKTFQTLFPPLSPQKLSLSSARRVVLVSYIADRGTVEFRHYLITVKPYGVSKRVRRVLEGATSKASSASKGYLDLGNEKDVADFFLRKKGDPGPSSDGYESAASSASSAGGDDGDAVSLADDYVGRNNKKGQKRAVRLDEIGPRMELRLIKITEGLPGREGGVIYHEFGALCGPLLRDHLVKRTKAEVAAQKTEHAAKEKLRRQRREEQERNVQRKKALTGDKKGGEDEDEGEGEGDEERGSDAEELEDDGDWDEDEEYSGGEGDDEEAGGSEEGESSADEAPHPPLKKSKRGKR
ncbi:Brix-domain-containing protein [Daedalea quercina L-15889]|uniref:Brix-domain-containing protein n=1 Tax=Daedalea quercina L-15889 TaxID=1314783 RepID=A0A165Q5S3_9APHY|nr:Brix-domain-containing protein [Daedalea quercina L-15889]